MGNATALSTVWPHGPQGSRRSEGLVHNSTGSSPRRSAAGAMLVLGGGASATREPSTGTRRAYAVRGTPPGARRGSVAARDAVPTDRRPWPCQRESAGRRQRCLEHLDDDTAEFRNHESRGFLVRCAVPPQIRERDSPAVGAPDREGHPRRSPRIGVGVSVAPLAGAASSLFRVSQRTYDRYPSTSVAVSQNGVPARTIVVRSVSAASPRSSLTKASSRAGLRPISHAVRSPRSVRLVRCMRRRSCGRDAARCPMRRGPSAGGRSIFVSQASRRGRRSGCLRLRQLPQTLANQIAYIWRNAIGPSQSRTFAQSRRFAKAVLTGCIQTRT